MLLEEYNRNLEPSKKPIILPCDKNHPDFEVCESQFPKMDEAGPATPCGLIAKSFFNDTFSLQKKGGSAVEIFEDNIAWSSDVQFRF